GEHRRLDLDLAPEPLREERPRRAVEDAAREDLVVADARLAALEAAGDAARGGELLAVLDGERDEAVALLVRLAHQRGDEHRGLPLPDQDCAVRLAGEPPRLERDAPPVDLERRLDDLEEAHDGVSSGSFGASA